MAFDRKRLQTFKWLEHVASKYPAGLRNPYNPYSNKIMCKDGRFYATNGYILVCAEWPELAHMGDDWEYVLFYSLNGTTLLEYPNLEPMEKHPQNPAFFRDLFFHPNMHNAHGDIRELHITPELIMEALKGFKINKLQPGIIADSTRIQFDAHNDDVSLSVLVMGCL